MKEQLGDTNKIRAVFAFAQGKAQSKDYAAALKSLKPLEALLQQALAAGQTGTAGDGALSVLEFAKRRLEWKTAQEKLSSQVADLQEAIIDESEESDAAAVAAKLDTISKELETRSTSLMDALDSVLNAATPEDRSKTLGTARQVATDYLNYVQSNPLLAHAVVNPFDGTPIESESVLADPLRRLLAEMQKASA